MKTFILFVTLFLFSINAVFSQLNYQASSGSNVAGVYTDLGSNGSVIATPGFDDDNSAPQAIGFNFLFNGTVYTQFILNTNGFIKLGTTAPAVLRNFDVLASAEANVITPLNMDLIGATAPEYRVYTSGIAPNRICTIQFEDVRDYFEAPATAPQFASMEFQVKLYETSNDIEFVYGTFVAGGAPLAAFAAITGIKGFDAPGSVNVTKPSVVAWSAATFIEGNYITNKHNIRKDFLPDAGRTYRFTSVTLPANDARVSNVYTLGKLPVGFGTPHSITSTVRNGGGTTLTNLQVTLDVTGANTYTNTFNIPSLTPGASVLVSFAGFSPVNAGTNTVTVTVPADDNNSNNNGTVTQTITTNTFSYADNSASTRAIGFNMGAGIISTKYTMNGSGTVTDVNVFLTNNTSNIGNTVYAVVMDAAGTIIAQSGNYVITGSDINNYKSFAIITPPLVANADFFVGLAQTANVTTGYFPVGSQNEITPARAGAFYRWPLTGVTSTEITTQGRYMVEAIVATAPVPITLESFTGKLVKNTANLSWQTSFESNSLNFEVERSAATNGAWTRIGTVAAIGNSSVTNSYQFSEEGLSNGEWLYRLKLNDKDGQFAYSSIITLEVNEKMAFVLKQNYPNPVRDFTNIQYQLGKDAIVVFEMYSMDGKKLAVQQKGKQLQGNHNITVHARSLGMVSGKYIYRLQIQDIATGEIIILRKEMNVIR